MDNPAGTLVLYNYSDMDADNAIGTLQSRGFNFRFLSGSYRSANTSFASPALEASGNNGPVLVFINDNGISDQLVADIRQVSEQLAQPVMIPVYLSPKAIAYSSALPIPMERGIEINYTDESYDRLAALLADQPPKSDPDVAPDSNAADGDPGFPEFNDIVNVFIDGNESERSNLLRQLSNNTTINRKALGARLRNEILNRFAPGQEKSFAASIRDPKRMGSARSWLLSALLTVDLSDPSTDRIVQTHLNARSEPDPNVRFWLLAGIYHHQPKDYIVTASAALKDPERMVAALASAIVSPDDDRVVTGFWQGLQSGVFDDSWVALRVMRIVPFPQLADAVVELFMRTEPDSTLAYDAIYALNNPATATAARDSITNKLGIDELVRRLSIIVRSATTARNFLHLLLIFPDADVDNALQKLRQNIQTRDTANTMLRILAQLRRERTEDNRPSVAGYNSDAIDVTVDSIDIRADVDRLAALMLAREVTPPLAIGLFGKWGSGKSFFMESLHARTKFLQGETGAADIFHTDVVHIKFNAWNYADTNLWAALVNYIFENLAEHVSPRQTDAQQLQSFEQKLAAQKAAADEARQQQLATQESLLTKQRELAEKEKARLERKVSVMELGPDDIAAILSPEQKKHLDQTLENIGIPAAKASIDQLETIVSDAYTAKGRWQALIFSIANSSNRWLIIGLMAFVFFIVPVIGWLIKTKFSVQYAEIAAGLMNFTAIAGSVAIVLKKGLQRVTESFNVMEDARKRIAEVLDNKRSNPTDEEVILKQEIAQLEDTKKQADKSLDDAVINITTITNQLAAFQQERSLARFLADRTGSEEYKKYLGILSTIRKDLQVLVEKLAQPELTQQTTKVSRIILYIDDLDRCPAEKVVEVLRAVHLLLAYPLFVVVVGVDPAWLLQSLSNTFEALRQDEDADATPLRFLEKIFQIPFSLKPMTEGGFTRLMHDLLIPRKQEKSGEMSPPAGDKKTTDIAHETTGTTSAPKETTTPGADDNNAGTHTTNASEAAKDTTSDNAGTPPTDNPSNATRPVDTTTIKAALAITEWEAQFAGLLFNFFPTPRAAKRFTNIYRLIKVGIDADELDGFEGTATIPGEFEIPMLLLAILVGLPAEAADLLPYLQEQAGHNKCIKDALEGYKNGATPGMQRCMEQLQYLVQNKWYEKDPKPFAKWIPKISRFSFSMHLSHHP